MTPKKFQITLEEELKNPEFALEFILEQNRHIIMLYDLLRAAERAIDNSTTYQVSIGETEAYKTYLQLRNQVTESGEYPIWT